MRCVVQRVSHASVTVEGKVTGEVERGFLVLVGVQDGDTEADVRYCAEKVSGLRVFEDENGKMNLSVRDVGGAVLAVSQFTLCGDARHGRRPAFPPRPGPKRPCRCTRRSAARLRAAGLPGGNPASSRRIWMSCWSTTGR